MGNLRQVMNHTVGWSLILWSESRVDHAPVIFDLMTMQVFPPQTIEVSIKIGSGSSDWFVTELPPN
jgi:hypothetical protein